jgi:predicted DNA-binding transcriptional regulator YafY
MYLSPTWDFKQELLSRADQIEVLEPDSLREWMSDMIQKMSEKYK